MSKAKRDNRSLNKIAFGILNTVSGGRSSNEESISINQIKYHVITLRSTFLRRDVDKNGELNLHAEQDLGCVELELVDGAECCNFETGCKILRSKKEIPDTVRLKNRTGITYVGTVDGVKKFPLETPYRARILSAGKFTGNHPRSFILNNRLYITKSFGIEVVGLRGIFSDPTKARNFKTCEGDPCYTDDDEFPIPDDMIPQIEDYIIKNRMRLLSSALEDQETDLQDSNYEAKQG